MHMAAIAHASDLARIIQECFAHSLDGNQSTSGTVRSGKPECSLDERLKEFAPGK